MNIPKEANHDAKPKMIDGKIVWSGGPSMRQNFALPESIMHYMVMNPSSAEVYKKLIQTCKYFFETNPILVAADIYGETTICSNIGCRGFEVCCVDTDLNKVSSKLWFTNALCYIEIDHENFISKLCSKIFRSELVDLSLSDQILTFDEFKFISASATIIYLQGCQITNNDGSIVMVEEILGAVPNIEEFDLFIQNNLSMITAATVKNIAKLKNLGKLTEFGLYNIPQVCNIADLSSFIKDHKDTKIRLTFDDNISEQYKQQLDALINTIIESDIPNLYVQYDGQDEEKKDIMISRYVL